MKKLIRLTEGDLHKIIRNCINEVKVIGKMDNLEPSKRYDMNSKRYQLRYDHPERFGSPYHDYDYDFLDGEKIKHEFLNRPNAARDFKNFPRFSSVKDFDFDPLENGKLHKDNVKKLLKNREKEEYDKAYDDIMNKPGFRFKMRLKYSQIPYEYRKNYTFEEYMDDYIKHEIYGYGQDSYETPEEYNAFTFDQTNFDY